MSDFLRDTIHALTPTSKKTNLTEYQQQKEKSFTPSVPSTPGTTDIDPLSFHEINTRRQGTSKMNLSIPADLKSRFSAKCAIEGRTKSALIQLWIKQYLSAGEVHEN